MEVLRYSGETPRASRACSNKQQPYSHRKKNVWIRVDPKERPKRNGNRKEMLCKFWANGDCEKGDRCPDLHSWSHGDHVSVAATLRGHNQEVTGIAYPSRGDKLYSGSKDGTVRVWNCYTGQCERVINLGEAVYSLIHESPWIFIGMSNLVKAWNIQSGAKFRLDGPVGQVYAMIFDTNILFAATQSGQILAWKVNSKCETTNPFQPAISLEGHTRDVVCLTIARNMLYSGSMDGTIKKWDLGTFRCLTTVKGHSWAVMSLVCWDSFLGVLALGGVNMPGMPNEEQRHDILLCSCQDNSVHLYELPSFQKKGRLFARQRIGSIHVQDGTGGLFFVGDGTGLITVGKMAC
ncbi:hypothetical protein TIFTF001_036500 [Ficus carica]|uniref:C3H1-type domain-containing protein n=1 Tax=Ficus carica TaxID=3494 RepID=A0AA88E3W1_FICCA|nr:hypothetical protein TIFTF001_036495 [Ficus carica]GMN67445.1 hypothetical protein TIFTF001_036500 [Ficus carica]